MTTHLATPIVRGDGQPRAPRFGRRAGGVRPGVALAAATVAASGAATTADDDVCGVAPVETRADGTAGASVAVLAGIPVSGDSYETMRDLPAGTVTFAFTDVEGSTRLLRELGAEQYAAALAQHRRIVRETFARHGGVEVDTQGDAFFYAFPTAPGAVAAAREGQESLRAGPVHVRVGIHTGTPLVSEEGYIGHDVHKAARIASAGHGGQVLVSSATASLVEVDELVDLGEHRLKDLSARERIYQLGGAEFPPLKTLYRTNLPIPATPFLGREHELAEISTRLEDDDVRLVTLTGPGGTGKTRLALQAAAEVADRFPDGVFWVALARLRDASLVFEEARQAIGAQGDLAREIAAKRILLVLDNFEHVLGAADGLAGLLSSCPNLNVLSTSRELLQLPGEHAYPVPPLEPSEGIELFAARAQAVKPDFRANVAVAELCARLDQLPLALELAAARVRMLSPEQLLERLSKQLDLLKAGRGVDPRQQTLRATIEWSHDLLDDDEKRLFARLSVFRGGCTLEAAEEAANADLEELQSLVDKNLVRVRDGERFWMLESIREYAAERLAESPDCDQLRQRHARFFTKFADVAEEHLLAGESDWFSRVEAEHDNIRAALDCLEASHDGEKQQQLAGAMSRFWQVRGSTREGLERLARALAADAAPTRARARALNAAAALEITALNVAGAVDPCRIAVAERRLGEARDLFERFGDRSRAARAYGNLGYIASLEGNIQRAKAIFAENVRTYEQLEDQAMVLFELRRLAGMEFQLGDYVRNIELHEEIIRRARESGNDLRLAVSLCALARDAIFEVSKDAAGSSPYAQRYSPERALQMLAESTRLSVTLQFHSVVAANFEALARALVVAGLAEEGAQILAKAAALFEEFGDEELGSDTDLDDETRAMARAQLDERTYDGAADRGRRLSSEDVAALALDALTAMSL